MKEYLADLPSELGRETAFERLFDFKEVLVNYRLLSGLSGCRYGGG